ncbi:hypothetical protein MKEN_00856000 [Mycena kentingensis (nom. inval.)]|nr:hypothetical protein MKEN_00856000 [Mycena kentingensis (nom. inval.)]
MKTTLVFSTALALSSIAAASPVSDASSGSRWAKAREQQQAEELREATLLGHSVSVPAQHQDVARLQIQWDAIPQTPFLSESERLPELVGPSRGHISVHAGDASGPFIGFLSVNKIVPELENATLYSVLDPGASLTEIEVYDANLTLAIAVGPFGESLGVGKQDFHLSRHAASGTSEAGPQWNTPLHTYVQTSVFSFDTISREITAHWENPDGEILAVVIAQAHDRIFYTGDMVEFEAVLGRKTSVVAFNWIELRED